MSYGLFLDPESQSSTLGQHLHGFNFFILQICKNNIILVKSLQKKIQWVFRQVF